MTTAGETQAATDVAPFAVATYDTDGRCVEANGAWLRLYGVPAEAVAGKTWTSAVRAEEHDRAVSALLTVSRGVRCEVVLDALRADGTSFTLEATLVPRRDADGGIGGFHAFGHPGPAPGGPGATTPGDPGGLAGEPTREDGSAVSPGVAARALGVSVSTVRRWIDEGRIQATRTTGGHRRITQAELRRFGSEASRPTRLKPSRLPERPLPALATVLSRRGERLLDDAARIAYEDGGSGWFAQERSRACLRVWLRRLARAAQAGVPQDAVAATRDMFVEARDAAGLEECQVFCDRFCALTLRALTSLERDEQTISEVRALLAALRRALASSEDERS